jgi:peptide/nickel transport system substrate-binding protein
VTPARALALAALSAGLAAAPRPAAAGLRPSYGGEVRLALPAAPRELDPALAGSAVDLFAARATSGLLVEWDGNANVGLLAEAPQAEDEARVFRLRLRPGLRRADGAPLAAADVAAHLARLLSRESPSPHAWAALAILGADAVLEGRGTAPAGLQVVSETELLVTLAFPFPAFAEVLATVPCAIPGAGPFVAGARRGGAPLVLRANPHHHRGRPYADALRLETGDARQAARLLERGGVDLVVRPEPLGARAVALPPDLLTLAALQPARLGPAAGTVRAALASLDRTELARRFVRGPSAPLERLVLGVAGPPSALTPAPPGGAAGARGAVRLLVHAGAPDQRTLAARIQVKLFDSGLRVAVEAADGDRFAERLRAGDYEVALVPVPLASRAPVVAAAQVVLAARGAPAARRALATLAGVAPGDLGSALDRLARELDLVPLVASGMHAAAGPALGAGLGPPGRGALPERDPGALWLVGAGARP